MARIKIPSSGEIRSWNEVPPGSAIECAFVRLRPGTLGTLTDLETGEGLITYGAPTVLKDRLNQIRPGAIITILYKGKMAKRGGSGQPYHDFDVYCEHEDRLTPRQRQDAAETAEEGVAL